MNARPLATRDAIAAALEVSPAESQIIRALYDGGLCWVSVETLRKLPPVGPWSASERSDAVVAVHICNIRTRLGDDFVLGFPGRGWTLGAPGVLACKRALA
jgi:hypothetical protein